jgi:hypothetical protein
MVGVSQGSTQGTIRRPLSDAAHQYACDQLWLSRGLESRLRSELTPQRFRCWTIASSGVSDEQLARFGAAVPVSSGDAEVVARELASIMVEGEDRVLVAPDPMGRPGDPFLTRVDTPYVTVGDGIYYVGRSPDIEALAAVWRAAASAAGQMAIVTGASVDTSANKLNLDEAARMTTALAFAAYDGLGALFFAALS